MQQITIALPFELPKTEKARNWYMELEFVDLHEGALSDLQDLANRAPTKTARAYLQGVLTVRQDREAFGPQASKARGH